MSPEDEMRSAEMRATKRCGRIDVAGSFRLGRIFAQERKKKKISVVLLANKLAVGTAVAISKDPFADRGARRLVSWVSWV